MTRRLFTLVRWLRDRRVHAHAFLRSVPISSRLVLLAGVFCAFSSIGFSADVLSPVVAPVPRVLFSAIGAGALAAGYFHVAIDRRPKWFAVLVVLNVLFLTGASGRAASGLTLAAASIGRLHTKYALDGWGVIVGFVFAYTLFFKFAATEGTRYLKAHAEIDLAKGIHRFLVPTIDRRIGRFEFYGVSVPSNEVGGDVVDLVDLSDGAWFGYVADVSGHGVGAGLVMGITKSAVRTRLLATSARDGLLDDVNRVLASLTEGNMFVTLAALRCNAGGQLEFCLAGHLPILHYQRAANAVVDLSVGDVPLGLFEDRTFAWSPVACETGDVFGLVTDGLTEVCDALDNELGRDPLKDVLHEFGPTSSLAVLAEEMLRRTRQHGVQRDDQSLLFVRVD